MHASIAGDVDFGKNMNTCLNGAFYATATGLRTHKPRIKLQYENAHLRCSACVATSTLRRC